MPQGWLWLEATAEVVVCGAPGRQMTSARLKGEKAQGHRGDLGPTSMPWADSSTN